MKTAKAIALLALAASFAPGSHAAYSCGGLVAHVGIDGGGDVTLSVGSGPIHRICNVMTQGSYSMAAASCKIAYAAILSAKLTDKSIAVYYQDNGFNCSTLPSWGVVPSTYFIQGPY